MRRTFTPDETLVDRLRIDDNTAIEELSHRYCFSLYLYCMTKLNSPEDSKKVVRNIFISLWESRAYLPYDFSLTVHLYTEVRKAVIQCINVKLNKEIDLPAIENQVIPGFSVIELQKARQPIKNNSNVISNYQSSIVSKRSYEQPWQNKFAFHQFKGFRYALHKVLNLW